MLQSVYNIDVLQGNIRKKNTKVFVSSFHVIIIGG